MVASSSPIIGKNSHYVSGLKCLNFLKFGHIFLKYPDSFFKIPDLTRGNPVE